MLGAVGGNVAATDNAQQGSLVFDSSGCVTVPQLVGGPTIVEGTFRLYPAWLAADMAGNTGDDDDARANNDQVFDLARQFPNRILNIHPSLLPSFPGLDAQHQALDHGVKISGCTVHFVDEGLDAGPIILQSAVEVLDGDSAETLSARILQEEHRIYSEAIRLVLAGNYRIEGRRVTLT